MTVKELEARTGLDRATIRFYEKEGLILPRRMANGYRDYTPADVSALEKITLLRRLGLSIQQIRRVQTGELPLGVALDVQEETLQRQERETFHARRILEAIREDGASYETLEPDKYKGRLPAPAAGNGEILPEMYVESANRHPLRRWFARSIDRMLCLLPGMLLAAYGMRLSPSDPAYSFFCTVMAVLSQGLLEPLLLCTWGYTPGKWLMGLKLRAWHPEGDRKPTFSQGLLRLIRVAVYGLGLNIPIAAWICGYKCWERSMNCEDQPWDEEEFHYTMEDRRFDWAPAAVLVPVLVLALGVFAVRDSMNPVNRKAQLTRSEYVENVNDLLEYTFDSELELNGEGIWFSDSLSSKGDNRDRLEIFEEAGIVTGVFMRYPLRTEVGGNAFTGDRQTQKTAAVLALVSGQKGVDLQKTLRQLDDFFSEGSGQLSLGDWTVEQRMEDPDGCITQFHYIDGMWIFLGETVTQAPKEPAVCFSVTRNN
ncbi:MAG: MerR family transcriptional regulator [Clostridia bacterium]|nr:MerR family transcriptional regulator [Clostridia bacterium]